MRRISPLLIGLSLTTALAPFAWSQSAATQPTTVPSAASAAPLPVTDPDLGKLFRSRVAGIEFNPPADGALIRDLNSGEIVRFMYGDSGWDVRAKTIPLHQQLRLSAAGDGGVLELMASQLLATSPSANILRQEVIRVNGQPVGLIEAKYNLGADKIFTQQAIFPDNNEPYLHLHYLLLQLSSRCDAKAGVNAPDPLETEARKMFEKVLPTVKVLDRSALAAEQKKRYFDTKMLLIRVDKNKIIPVIQPLRLERIVRDGKDIGFIQVNERLATHSGNDGVEVIVRSRVQTEAPDPAAVKPGADANPAPAGGGIVLPGSVGAPAANIGAAKPAGPSNVFTSSTFFVTFDRAHEDWTSITQVDDQVATQLVESANTDLTNHIDRAKAIAAQREIPKPGEAAPDVTVPDYILNIQYSHGRRQDKLADIKLLPDYLPQGTAQLLPRLLAHEPGQYLFTFYVSGEQKVMRRYIDVEQPHEVTIDGNTVRAVAVSDRIGVDGIPTIQYVSTTGEWLGSVNEEQKLWVLPTDEKTLTDIWSKQPLGFKVADVPPPQVDMPVAPRRTAPAQQTNGPVNMQGPAPMGR